MSFKTGLRSNIFDNVALLRGYKIDYKRINEESRLKDFKKETDNSFGFSMFQKSESTSILYQTEKSTK